MRTRHCIFDRCGGRRAVPSHDAVGEAVPVGIACRDGCGTDRLCGVGSIKRDLSNELLKPSAIFKQRRPAGGCSLLLSA